MNYKEGRILRGMGWGVQVCDENRYRRMRGSMEWTRILIEKLKL